MRKLIKKLLREALEVKEAEFDEKGHTVERIKQRINSIPDEDIPFNVKEVILHNIDKLIKTDFSPNKSFAVMLGKFNPKKNSDLYVSDERGNGYYRIWSNDPGDVIKDSTGDEIWAIVRGNVIHTIFLRKGWQTKNSELNADKLNVDAAFKNVDSAIRAFGSNKSNKNINQRKKDEPIININGVKWVIDPDKNIIYKKNNQKVFYKIDDIIDELPEETQEKIITLL